MRLAALSLVIATLAGCDRNGIKVYRLAKADAAEARPQKSLPSGWQELPPDQMRVGNYAVEGPNGAKAQVTIIPLPGSAGSELDNVNRWRGQVGEAPLAADQLSTYATQIQIAGAPARLFDLTGTDQKTKTSARILAAVQPHGDSQWFFKMMGDDELVRSQKDAFISFLQNYHYPDAIDSPSTPTAAAAVPEPMAKREVAQSEVPQAQRSAHRWPTLAGWEPQQPGPMQDAKFSVAAGKATATVSIFDAPTGGVLANVNRWRGQIGLSPVDDAALASLMTTMDLPDGKASVVDMKGPQQRMIAAIASRGGSTWFFKLLGDDAAVGAEKDKFVQFVKGSK